MSNETATVEALTAEVRVLMVGNRQITQSVAKQLDRVSLDGMEMFGRVRIADDLHIIGRRLDASDLVLTKDSWITFRKSPHWAAFIEQNSRFIHACNVDRRNRAMLFKIDDIPCEVDWENVHCDHTHYKLWRKVHDQWAIDKHEWWTQHKSLTAKFPVPEPEMHAAHSWIPNPDDYHDARQQAVAQLNEANRRHELYETAQNLPLIVLAGLR